MTQSGFQGPIERVNDWLWRIPKSYSPNMRVDGLIYASDELMQHLRNDPAPQQVANVATLPGIQVTLIGVAAEAIRQGLSRGPGPQAQPLGKTVLKANRHVLRHVFIVAQRQH